MKRRVLFAATVMILAGLAQAQEKQGYTPKTLEEKKSYLIGFDVGANLRGRMLSPDMNILLRGILDGMKGAKPTIAEEEISKVIQAILDESAANHKRAGEEFLASNRKQPGVVTLPSGLQYKVLKKGSGKSPKTSDKVAVHFKGSLIDGTAFFDSKMREQGTNEPMNINVGKVIKGWSEALQLMKEGDTWQLFIPTNLAFGLAPPQELPVPPNAALVYELELVKVVGPAEK
jgi:FKBP-type peptidyl-prolyl cis-trans isomerase FklB